MIIKVDRKTQSVSEILQNLVSKAYDKNDPYTMKDYWETEIEWLPLDFTGYENIKSETQRWINKLFAEETIDKNGNKILKGSTGPNRIEMIEMEYLGIHVGEYTNGYSLYGFNDEEMLIYTYCEGDTTLTLFNDRDIYEKEKERTIEWYRKEYAA